MNKREARELMAARVEELRAMPYDALVDAYFKNPVCEEIAPPSGATYQLEIEAFWDDKRRKRLRVVVGIDDGGWRALCPLCEDFIVAPDGSFIGE